MLLVGALAFSGCANPPAMTATGTVDDVTVAVSVPVLLAVKPDPDAGFSPVQDADGAPTNPTPSLVAAVTVTSAAPLGARVREGDTIATLDSSLFEAALDAAQADEKLAASRIKLLASHKRDVADKRVELQDKRQEIDDAIATLTSKESELVGTRSELRSKQTELAKQLATVESQRTQLKNKSKELRTQKAQVAKQISTLSAQQQQLRQALQGNPDDPTLQAQLAQVSEALSAAQAGLAQLAAASDQVSQGITKIEEGRTKARQASFQLSQGFDKLDEGLRTLQSNLGQAREGRTKLDDGLAELADAATKINQAHELSRIQATASGVAVDRAEDQEGRTTLIAPADGIVVATSQVGDVLRPGAPVVTIRPDRASTITTWLPPAQATALCDGSEATVSTDWGATHSAQVTRIGADAEYPPTSQATDEVHLTRAVEVTLTIADTDFAPPGAGVDLRFTPCKEN